MQKAFYNTKTGEAIIEDFTAEETQAAEAKAALQLELNKKRKQKH